MKIWALATDGDADGTVASVYTDEKQMYLDLAERMGTEEGQEQAKNFSADIEALKEFVSEIESSFLFTYSIDEREIEVPEAAILQEFTQDVEAFGYAETCKDWPDLSITYQKAKKLIAAQKTAADPEGTHSWDEPRTDLVLNTKTGVITSDENSYVMEADDPPVQKQLKERFPWLGTDEEVAGSDVVESLSDWYESLTGALRQAGLSR